MLLSCVMNTFPHHPPSPTLPASILNSILFTIFKGLRVSEVVIPKKNNISFFFNLKHFSRFLNVGSSCHLLLLARGVQEILKKLIGLTMICNKHALLEIYSLTGKLYGSIFYKTRNYFICREPEIFFFFLHLQRRIIKLEVRILECQRIHFL